MTSHLRIARPVNDLERASRMYQAGLGLSVVGSFEGHDGFDGVMLGVPGAAHHFEFTVCRSHPLAPSPTPEDLVVLYEPDEERWSATCERMAEAGFREVASFNPYWDRLGRTFEDHDGYRVVVQNAAWENVSEAGIDVRPDELSERDLDHLRAVFGIAEDAARRGNAPFGARLVAADGSILAEAGNRVATTGDPTAHAEIVLIREASSTEHGTLKAATLYTSAEPCAMCAGAISWMGIGRVVFGIGAARVRELHGAVPSEPGVPGRVVLARAAYGPGVIGPALEDEGAERLFGSR